MKKIFLMLLGIAATINAMAVDYTASAMVRVTSNTGYYSDFYYSESASLGALNGNAMNFEGRKVALYALNGTAKLQIIEGADLEGVQLGLMTDNGTDYTFNVSYVEGTNPLYLMDAQGENHELTQGASFTINGLAANSTIEDRFTLGRPSAPVSGFDVTLNAFGLATFSGDQDAEIPTGLKAYTATYVAMDEVLNLDEITTGKIPANTGVILFGTAGADYTLPYTTGAAAVGTNHLQPATTASVEDVFVLSGNALYQYTGVVPANKAYLQLPGGAPAPARIGLRFGTATAVESVEAEAVKAEKFVENGQVFIRRGEAVYNLQGQLVK